VGFFVNFVQEAGKKAWIRVTRGMSEGRIFVLDKSPMILGRSELVDIPVFGDLSITEQNARFLNVGGRTELDSLGNNNLALNRERIQKAALNHLDVFTIGNTQFIYLNKLEKLAS
jgi:hypothetical protein